MARERKDIIAILALIGGFLAVLCSLYYMQQLSYSLGVYSGISSVVNTYRINASTALLAALSQSSTLSLALYLAYVLVTFSLIILAIGILWMFTNSYGRFTEEILVFASIMYIIVAGILGINFHFSGSLIFPGSIIAGIIPLACSAYLVLATRKMSARRAASPIAINPDTPYSNIKILSTKLMSKLSGEIKILDMHFDAVALDNLLQLMDKNIERYTKVSVLTKKDRLGTRFMRSYKDFRAELSNKNVAFELRVLNEEEAAKQHERMLLDSSTAYKIPPLNIINTKSEHILSIRHDHAERRFNDLWSEATKIENIGEQNLNM